MLRKNLSILLVLVCLFILWTGLIFYFSSQPPAVSNSQSGWAVKIINAVNETFDITGTDFYAQIEAKVKDIWFFGRYKSPHAVVRKSAHFGIYFLLGMITGAGGFLYARKLPVGFLLGLSIPVTVAVLDEYNQGFVGRTSSLNDVIIDGTGAFFGALTVILFFSVIKIFNYACRFFRRHIKRK